MVQTWYHERPDLYPNYTDWRDYEIADYVKDIEIIKDVVVEKVFFKINYLNITCLLLGYYVTNGGKSVINKDRLQQVEKIILPFLTKLLKTADQPIIKWPNRKTILEAQIQKVLI